MYSSPCIASHVRTSNCSPVSYRCMFGHLSNKAMQVRVRQTLVEEDLEKGEEQPEWFPRKSGAQEHTVPIWSSFVLGCSRCPGDPWFSCWKGLGSREGLRAGFWPFCSPLASESVEILENLDSFRLWTAVHRVFGLFVCFSFWVFVKEQKMKSDFIDQV